MVTVAATAGGKSKPQKLEDFMPVVWEGAKKKISTDHNSLDGFQTWAQKYG